MVGAVARVNKWRRSGDNVKMPTRPKKKRDCPLRIPLVTIPLGSHPMPVILLGTLDTKGVEFQFARDLLKGQGVDTLVIDAGDMGPPHFTPDVLRDQVFAASGP